MLVTLRNMLLMMTVMMMMVMMMMMMMMDFRCCGHKFFRASAE